MEKFPHALALEIADKEITRICRDWGIKRSLIDFKVNYSLSKSSGKIEVFLLRGNCLIKINKRYLDEFGIDRMIGTIRHEMAHFIRFLQDGPGSVNDNTGHDKNFLEVLKVLGGTANSVIAADAPELITNEWIESKYVYTCTCGAKYKRARRFNERMLHTHSCGRCHRKLINLTLTTNY